MKNYFAPLNVRMVCSILCLLWFVFAAVAPVAMADSGDLVLVVDKNKPNKQAWVRFKDNTRQPVTAHCANSLKRLGVQVWSWSKWQLRQLPDSRVRTCKRLKKIALSNSSAPRVESSAVYTLLVNEMNSAPHHSAWVLHASGHRQWVSADCRGKLRDAGTTEQLLNYATISRYPDGVWIGCQSMLQTLSEANGSGSPDPQTPVVTTTTPETTQPEVNTTTTVPTTERSVGQHCLGVNDGFSLSWDGGQLSTDAFKKARGPLLHDFKTPAPMDSQKWPVGNQSVVFVLGEGDHGLEDLNPWVLLPYEQAGSWISPPGYGSWEIQGANYVQPWSSEGIVGHEFNLGSGNNVLNIFQGYLPTGDQNRWHLVPKSVARQYAKAMSQENLSYIFNTDKYASDPAFPLVHDEALTKLRSFCRLRFMTGSNVNSLEFSGYNRDRSKPSHPTWNTVGGDGIPYEWKVWIANRAKLGVWHTDHILTWEALQAGDSYLKKEAAYYRDHLDGTLIREYGNEVWNFAWPFNVVTEHVWKSHPFADPGKTDAVNIDYGYAQRAYDTAKVWEEQWASRRQDLDLTIGVHTHNAWGAAKRLVGPSGQRWFDRIDSVAATFYFGSVFNSSDSLYRDILAKGEVAVVDDHDAGADYWKEKISELLEQTGRYVGAFHMYEGASHQVFSDYSHSNANHRKVREHMTSYLNSNAYVSHLNKMFKWWLKQDKAGEAIWFSLFGVNNPRSPWGVYPNTRSRSMTYSGTNTFINQYIERQNGT